MQGLHRRLEKLEEAVNPRRRIAMFFVRHGHKEDDFAKQKKEYFTRRGRHNSPIFLVITEYCDLDYDYETFIQRMRARYGEGNCYTDWWEKRSIFLAK